MSNSAPIKIVIETTHPTHELFVSNLGSHSFTNITINTFTGTIDKDKHHRDRDVIFQIRFGTIDELQVNETARLPHVTYFFNDATNKFEPNDANDMIIWFRDGSIYDAGEIDILYEDLGDKKFQSLKIGPGSGL